ncbi:VOC family protein [Cryptosporangium sp. NPDC048952]|uniref:VOC family protein n=1 Tax=Cryptosporangium sp. NPDC048952 TaxID=3363961 RepID=UPI0037236277
MNHIGRLDRVVFDAPDIDKLSEFYTTLTGWPIVATEPDVITLRTPSGHGFGVHAPDYRAPEWPGQDRPHQVHLDLDVEDLEEGADRAVALGAQRIGGGPYWVTLTDPAGHVVDLCLSRSVAPMSRLWVSFDVADSSGAARFYSVLLGMRIDHDNEVAADVVAEDGTTVCFQPVPGYQPPRWPDPAFPQQAHLDVRVEDLDVATERVLAHGATPLTDRVFADPAGHPFCLYG